MSIGQYKATWWCKWLILVINFGTNARDVTQWPNFELSWNKSEMHWTICCETGSWTVVGVPSTTPHLPHQHHHHHHHLWQLLLDHHFWQKYEDSHLRWFLIRLWMIYDQIWWKYIWEKLAYDSCPDMIIGIVIITIIVILSFHRSGSVRNDDTFFFSSPSHLFFSSPCPAHFPVTVNVLFCETQAWYLGELAISQAGPQLDWVREGPRLSSECILQGESRRANLKNQQRRLMVKHLHQTAAANICFKLRRRHR